MKKLVGLGSIFSVLGLAACGHAGLMAGGHARLAAPRLAGHLAGVTMEDYAVKPLVTQRAVVRRMPVRSGRSIVSSKFALMSARETLNERKNGGRALQNRGLASEHGPYDTGKKGTMAMLNKAMLLKSGALENSKAIHVGKRRKGSLAMLNKAMLLKSGALENSKAIHAGKRHGGRLGQLNKTMLIRSGAMARTDAIRVHRTVRMHVPSVALHRSFHARSLSRVPAARMRSPLGGRCFGTNCDD